mgnify:CR=1 FL=1
MSERQHNGDLVAALRREISGLEIIEDAAAVEARSRDYWMRSLLQTRLGNVPRAAALARAGGSPIEQARINASAARFMRTSSDDKLIDHNCSARLTLRWSRRLRLLAPGNNEPIQFRQGLLSTQSRHSG